MFKSLVFALVISSAYSKLIIKGKLIQSINLSKRPEIVINSPTIQPPDNGGDSRRLVDLTQSENATSRAIPNKCDKINFLDGELDNISEDCDAEIIQPALILTPFIENGKVEEARRASEVDPELFLGFKSHSGFFTINKTYDSNTFFWYFPVEDKPVNETPWIIWLQGGPGGSSLIGLFDEIGPIKWSKSGILERNPYSWTKNHSLVFIDNPVGSGYSFTNHAKGFASDMATYSRHLYSAVKQMLEVFPELRTAPLYVAGESYAGKYIPALGIELHRHKIRSQIDVNLQGFVLGNAYIDPMMIKNVAQPFFDFGLVNKEQIELVEPLLKALEADIANNNSVAANEKWSKILVALVLLSNQKHAFNFLKDDLGAGEYVKFLDSPKVRNAIHVGNIKYSFTNYTVHYKMASDFLSSSNGLLEELLNTYKVLSYCGQLDQAVPCKAAAENHRTWQWKGSQEFIDSTRRPYLYQQKLGGYFKTGGNLTEVVIRGAGHMVPMDTPGCLQKLVTDWIQNQPFTTRDKTLEAKILLLLAPTV